MTKSAVDWCACPTCGAPKGERCRKVGARPPRTVPTHAARLDAAYQLARWADELPEDPTKAHRLRRIP